MTDKHENQTHTPGPWLMRRKSYEGPEGGEIYCHIYEILADDEGRRIIIAEVTGGDLTPAPADAKLIAAAPDLLEASKKTLRKLYKLEEQLPSRGLCSKTIKLLENAIQKATAESRKWK